jgi:flagellar motor switch protein FliN/FliY
MSAISPGTPQHSFIDAIRKAVGDVFSQALSSPWKLELGADKSAQSADVARLYFAVSLSGNLQGTATLQVRTADALLLSQKFLGEPLEASAELNDQHKEALEELLRQVAGVAETTLKGVFGELKVQLSRADAPSTPGITVPLPASEASSGTLALELLVSNELLASVDSCAAKLANPPTENRPETLPHPDNNLDLLLGVHLNLTLRFGQRVLTLREILDLTSGSVIELDRQVQEPSDLLLGDRLIARGEVVIVDGNYGIRITEVEDPRQRIQRI